VELLAIVRRERGHRDVARERHKTYPESIRDAVEERVRRLLRGSESRRRDVAREHRARGVDDEENGCVLHWDNTRHLGTCDGDAEKCEGREREACDRELATCRHTRRDAAQHLDVREAHGVARAATPREEVPGGDRREQDEREERERNLEAQSILRKESRS
jgi:hypothetical protein